ncbi:hypothetical protein WBP07_22920 (plasmid) [Novosphingobium sp. BL-8A]|uniref:hypothetical protein n=1 Tax=Novosphingobium sp. BL-8A TaxID=3127639 RepID=UPI00375799E5
MVALMDQVLLVRPFIRLIRSLSVYSEAMKEREKPRDRTPLYDAMSAWRPAVGMLLKRGNRPTELQGIGTCFLVTYERVPFLVTALHNLDEFRKGDTLDIWFDGIVFPLEQVGFVPSIEDDLAVAWFDWEAALACAVRSDPAGTPYDTWLARVTTLLESAIEIESSIDGAVRDFGLLGFPGSRNVLYFQPGKPVTAEMFAITFDLLGISRDPDGEFEKLYFGYKEGAHRVPSAKGLSGSPVIGLVPGLEEGTFRPALWAVAVKRFTSEGVLVGVYVSKVISLLDRTVAKIHEAMQSA